MCGRYSLRRPHRIDPKLLGLEELPPLDPRFNIAPGENILLVRSRGGEREATLARWGLVPAWAKDPSIGSRLANARAESLAEKPSFRNAWKSRRGLVLADGFYEWRALPGSKRRQPYFVSMTDDEPFAFGAIWEAWKPRDGSSDWTISCSLITTQPNPLLADLHDRMPVIVAPENHARWLGESGAGTPPEDLLQPYPEGSMRAHPVSTHVNAPANDDERCIAPLVAEDG